MKKEYRRELARLRRQQRALGRALDRQLRLNRRAIKALELNCHRAMRAHAQQTGKLRVRCRILEGRLNS